MIKINKNNKDNLLKLKIQQILKVVIQKIKDKILLLKRILNRIKNQFQNLLLIKIQIVIINKILKNKLIKMIH